MSFGDDDYQQRVDGEQVLVPLEVWGPGEWQPLTLHEGILSVPPPPPPAASS